MTSRSAFGPPMRLPYVQPLEGEPEVIRVLNEADEQGGVFGGDWHTDFTFLERPPAGSVLSAEVVPPYGGDTVWVSQPAAIWDRPALWTQTNSTTGFGVMAWLSVRYRWRRRGRSVWMGRARG